MGGQNQKDGWDIFNIFVPIISALILITFGTMASTSIQNAIKERQLEVSSGQAMQELLTLLMSKETKFDKFEASAYALAAFGPVAALPLIKVIDTHSDYKKRNVARDALLLQASLGNSKTACAALTMTIGKHSRVFNWKTHQSAIELIGHLKCENAVKEIEDYFDFFKKIELAPSGDLKKHSLEVMKTIAREHEFEELNQEQIDKSILNLCETVKKLDRLQKRTREEKNRCP